LWVVYN